MLNYIVKIIGLLLFSLFIAYSFYSYGSPSIHLQNFDGYTGYVIAIIFVYAIYKFIQVYGFSGFENTQLNSQASFSPLTLLGYFLIHLLIICIFYTVVKGVSLGLGIILFLKILLFSFLPGIIIILSFALGKYIIHFIDKRFKGDDVFMRGSLFYSIFSFGVGFSSLLILLLFIGFIGLLNIWVITLLFFSIAFLAKTHLIECFSSIFSYKIEFQLKQGSGLTLLSAEFFFLVSTFILGVGLISIVRPFPIGWDDLGVYMNFPHLIAEAGSILSLGGMYTWQVFTSIGYIFHSPTQAFFINSLGGICSFVLIIAIISDLLKGQKKTFIHIPLIIGTLLISMPMVFFQQAKDMKLDMGLFFISIIAIYGLYKYYASGFSVLNTMKSKEIYQSKNMFFLFLVGIIIGLSFTIKFTALFLIVASIGLLFFVRLGIFALLGYIFLFISLFTFADLWGLMNVVLNPNEIKNYESYIVYAGLLLGIGSFAAGYVYYKEKIKNFFIEIVVLLSGILVAILPWLIKNTIDIYPEVGLKSIIIGKAEKYDFDLSILYSDEEIKNRKDIRILEAKSGTGTTRNEDLGRYLGYEKGLNNYVKLPWNLTMQVNQKGEYMNIGFLFLALIPIMFLFLSYRSKYNFICIIFIILLHGCILYKQDNNIIPSSELLSISDKVKSKYFIKNDLVFQKRFLSHDIYDINIRSYDSYINATIDDKLIDKRVMKELDNIVKTKLSPYSELLQNKKISIDDFQKRKNEFKKESDLLYDKIYGIHYKNEKLKLHKGFYNAIRHKIMTENPIQSIDLGFIDITLNESDIHLMRKLSHLHNDYFVFRTSVISKGGDEQVNKLWIQYRTLYQFINEVFSKVVTPFTYGVLLLITFILCSVGIYGMNKHSTLIDDIFKINMVFAGMYIFLWVISSFGIVWYGISMYFLLFLMIVIPLYYLASYDSNKKDRLYYVKLGGSIVFLVIILVYVFLSVYPYSFQNLKKAGYTQFKGNQVSHIEAPFFFRPGNIKDFFALNIADERKEEFLRSHVYTDDLKLLMQNNNGFSDIGNTIRILNTLIYKGTNVREAKISLRNIYDGLINPSKEYKNTDSILRVGTFFKYYVSDNYKRMLDDNLLFNYYYYIHHPIVDKTIENIKSLGFKYILVDLNAPTIDKDPRHHLTKRYESLLSIFFSDKIELVSSDSLCLQTAIESYQNVKRESKGSPIDDKIMKNLYMIAGKNFISYEYHNGKELPIGKASKRLRCYQHVYSIIKNNQVSGTNYSFLLDYALKLKKNKEKYGIRDNMTAANELQTNQHLRRFFDQHFGVSYKALFKIKD